MRRSRGAGGRVAHSRFSNFTASAMFSGRLVSSLALSLALLPAIVQAHEAALLGDAGSPALRARFSLSAKSNAAQLAPIDSGLDRRQAAGSSCGPNAGGAVCGPGLCCSANVRFRCASAIQDLRRLMATAGRVRCGPGLLRCARLPVRIWPGL